MSLKIRKRLKDISKEEYDQICSSSMCEACSIGYVDIKQGKEIIHICKYHIMMMAIGIGEEEVEIK